MIISKQEKKPTRINVVKSIPGEIAHFRVLHADHTVSTAGGSTLGSLSFHFVGVDELY